MLDSGDLSIVIPAFNEEGGVAQTLRTLKASFPQAEIILVDDCSDDATLQEARGVDGVRIVRHRFNRGYGAALKTGMATARGTFIAWFDADGEHRVEDLAAMFQHLQERHLAAVVGRRPSVGQQPIRFFGKLILRIWARTLGVKVDRDLNCGLRVFHKEAILPYLTMLPDKFSASTTSTMIMLERGYPVAFHDIRTNPRIGKSKVRLRHGFETLLNILRTTMIFGPLRVYGSLGLGLATFSLAYGIMIALIIGRGFPGFALAVLMAGLFLIVIGVVADQLSRWQLSAAAAHSLDLRRARQEHTDSKIAHGNDQT